jgi:hypothetical protein
MMRESRSSANIFIPPVARFCLCLNRFDCFCLYYSKCSVKINHFPSVYLPKYFRQNHAFCTRSGIQPAKERKKSAPERSASGRMTVLWVDLTVFDGFGFAGNDFPFRSDAI